MSAISAKAPFLIYATNNIPATASGTPANAFSKVLPEGKWLINVPILISGSLTNVVITYNGIGLFQLTATYTSIQSPIAFLYASDGTTPLTIEVTANTSSGTWASLPTAIKCDKLN
jgi:hypothetical protein